MTTKPVKLKNAYQRCDCGHENRLHAKNAGDAGECQMMGCPCTSFAIQQRLPIPRTRDASMVFSGNHKAGWARKMPHRGRRS